LASAEFGTRRTCSKRQRDIVLDFLEDQVGSDMSDARHLEHELIQKPVVCGHILDHDPEVVIGITGRRETFEDFCSPPYTGDELRDELRIVAVERYVKDGGCCEARLGLLLVRPSA
jgi:hypothetical protein